MPETIARRINSNYASARQSMVDSANRLISAGKLLTEAKTRVAHGDFTNWIVENCDFSPSTARRLMAGAKRALAHDLDEISAFELNRQIWGHKAIAARRAITADVDVLNDYIAAANYVMDGIERYQAIEDDALAEEWNAESVWLNLARSEVDTYSYVEKLIAELTEGRTTSAILLTHNHTNKLWFHRAEEIALAICFVRDRERCSSAQGQALFYFGEDEYKFREKFSAFGFIR